MPVFYKILTYIYKYIQYLYVYFACLSVRLYPINVKKGPRHATRHSAGEGGNSEIILRVVRKILFAAP